jgi:hypothetical protein
MQQPMRHDDWVRLEDRANRYASGAQVEPLSRDEVHDLLCRVYFLESFLDRMASAAQHRAAAP